MEVLLHNVQPARAGKVRRGMVTAAILAALMFFTMTAVMAFPTDWLPPPSGVYTGTNTVSYLIGAGTTISLRNFTLSGFTGSVPPPPLGGILTHSFGANANMEFSLDGGLTWSPASATGPGWIQTNHYMDIAPTRYFQEEMLDLSLNGSGVFGPFMMRESPTKQSLGHTTILTEPGGTFQIDSFFDVFTELSLDGGQTWIPSSTQSPLHIALSSPATMDFGDAPDSMLSPGYPTLLVNNGARHQVVGKMRMGANIDIEPDGQPDSSAKGDDNNPPLGPDDEDGVIFISQIIAGSAATVKVNVSDPGKIDAWIDFNANGSWADTGDQILVSESVVAGDNTLTYTVPNTAVAGATTFARFRYSTNGGLSYTGLAPDGEVEDYRIKICPKWTQMPDLTPLGIDVNATSPYILADDFQCKATGPITGIHLWGSWLADILPEDAAGNQRADLVKFTLSIHEDVPAGLNIPYSHPGELLWMQEFYPGQFEAIPYAMNIVEGWMYPPNEYMPIGDHACWKYEFPIDSGQFIQTGTPQLPKVYWLDVQATSLGLNTQDNPLFGWKTSVNHWNDAAVWGQGSEPYLGLWQKLIYPNGHQYKNNPIDLAFVIFGVAGGIDWGDAPDSILFPSYPTLAASNGASHQIVSGFCLGQFIDAELDGQPDPNAMGDDNNPLIGPDDEDGVFFLTPLVPGQPAIVNVIASAAGMLDVWVDFNGNG
ncbi:MAG: GEVED domain-containing protein, partial [Armatimonadetes bacterium]|nr:GEVED domain-containing protein [Armatimonadota bacterium]